MNVVIDGVEFASCEVFTFETYLNERRKILNTVCDKCNPSVGNMQV
jgi:hypothetical protein